MSAVILVASMASHKRNPVIMGAMYTVATIQSSRVEGMGLTAMAMTAYSTVANTVVQMAAMARVLLRGAATGQSFLVGTAGCYWPM